MCLVELVVVKLRVSHKFKKRLIFMLAMFCKECGSILMPKKVDGVTVMACTCGYSEDTSGNPFKEKVESKSDDVAIAESDTETLPITDEECSKCGHDKAYYWLVQTRAGDEPETKFLKCTKCKHTWRDYS